MVNEISFLISGIVFGSAAGFSPGPLQTLVISETLRHSAKEGMKISLAPLMTDLPIILVTVLILLRLSNIDAIMGVISISGAVFLSYLAYESIAIKKAHIDNRNARMQAISKGVITNFLNPHPYMFWFLVGAPTIVKALHTNILSVSCFLLSFYVVLVGILMLIAVVVSKFRFFLNGAAYILTIRCLGILLFIFSCIFLRDGLKFLGVI